jgi:bacillithiol biosynthesis deacetylase BshB1
MEKLDILAIGAHPDDVELAACGTVLLAVLQGKKVGILDLTRGELGSRGSAETRAHEAAKAAAMLGVSFRENVGLPDGFLENNRDQQLAIVPFIRKYQPRIVITNSLDDRHPDHGKAAKLVSDACFLSGLRAIGTTDAEGHEQLACRPVAVYHFIQDRYLKPDFVVDISQVFSRKLEIIAAFSSQFYTGEPQKPDEITPISTPEFWKFLEARAREFGRAAGFEFGEGFNTERPIGISDISNLL